MEIEDQGHQRFQKDQRDDVEPRLSNKMPKRCHSNYDIDYHIQLKMKK